MNHISNKRKQKSLVKDRCHRGVIPLPPLHETIFLTANTAVIFGKVCRIIHHKIFVPSHLRGLFFSLQVIK